MKVGVKQRGELLQKLRVSPEALWPVEVLNEINGALCLLRLAMTYVCLEFPVNCKPAYLKHLVSNQPILRHG